MDIQSVKQKFGIIGNSPLINRAIDIAIQVASTDLSVLITGESGVGKEVFPKIIHTMSSRKHGNYIAVNCGAIPEGTIDSELFGHEKGAFTGAIDSRKGYFEEANGGTIFLDEVAELPLGTQVRLLRVLESGEFIRVGSSKVIKTNVRVVAATNVDIPRAIENGKFREDLYYRLNTVPIKVPPLRERSGDVVLLFRKFAADFAAKYRMPSIQLTEESKAVLMNYSWKGNIRQLKNLTEQISIIEKERNISPDVLQAYLPIATSKSNLPVLFRGEEESNHVSERDLLYKVLFDMKHDINELKKFMRDIIGDEKMAQMLNKQDGHIFRNIIKPQENFDDFFADYKQDEESYVPEIKNVNSADPQTNIPIQDSEIIEESLSIQDKEIELIRRALKRHNNKRKMAAKELGISERTLYRKIKDFNI